MTACSVTQSLPVVQTGTGIEKQELRLVNKCIPILLVIFKHHGWSVREYRLANAYKRDSRRQCPNICSYHAQSPMLVIYSCCGVFAHSHLVCCCSIVKVSFKHLSCYGVMKGAVRREKQEDAVANLPPEPKKTQDCAVEASGR